MSPYGNWWINDSSQEYDLCWPARSQPSILHACVPEKGGVTFAAPRLNGLTVDVVQILHEGADVSTSKWEKMWMASTTLLTENTCLPWCPSFANLVSHQSLFLQWKQGWRNFPHWDHPHLLTSTILDGHCLLLWFLALVFYLSPEICRIKGFCLQPQLLHFSFGCILNNTMGYSSHPWKEQSLPFGTILERITLYTRKQRLER